MGTLTVVNICIWENSIHIKMWLDTTNEIYASEHKHFMKRKPILHWKPRSHWLSNARRQETNNMKSTWQMQSQRKIARFDVYSTGSPKASRWVPKALRWHFEYQHVGIGNAKSRL